MPLIFGHLVLFTLSLLTTDVVNGNRHRRNTTDYDVTCGTSIPIRTVNYPGQYPIRHLEYWRFNIPAEVLMTLVCDHFHIPRPDNRIKITVLNGVGHPVKPTETYDSGEDIINQWTYSPNQIWPYDTTVSLKLFGSFRQNHLGTGLSCTLGGQCPLSTTTTTTTTSPAEMTAVVIVVRDVSTNIPIPNVTVDVTFGGNTVQFTTDSNGRIDLGQQPVGSSITVTANLNGYVSFSRDFTVATSQIIYVDISPAIMPSEIRVAMSYNSAARHLDFHNRIFDRQGNLICRVTFFSNSCGIVRAENHEDFGVESILWNGFDDNMHLLYVHDYSFAFQPVGIVASGVRVTIYGENDNIELLVPNEPTSPARYWVIGCFDGAVGYTSFRELNYLSNDEPLASSLCLFSFSNLREDLLLYVTDGRIGVDPLNIATTGLQITVFEGNNGTQLTVPHDPDSNAEYWYVGCMIITVKGSPSFRELNYLADEEPTYGSKVKLCSGSA